MANKVLWTATEIQARIDQAVGDITGDNNTTISELETKIETNTSNIASLQSSVSTAQSTASEAKSIAQGRSRAVYYEDNASANTGINAFSNNELKIGDNIYIGAVGVPDWYVCEILSAKAPTSSNLPTSGTSFNDNYSIGFYKLAQLESEKVDLTEYAKKNEGVKSGSYNSATKTITLTLADNSTTISIPLTQLFTQVETLVNEGVNTAKTYADNFKINNISPSATATTRTYTITQGTTPHTLSFPAATNSSASVVSLLKSANFVSTSWNTQDTSAITSAYLKSVLDHLNYATNSTVSALSNTVNTHETRLDTAETDIDTLEADQITITISDGETAGGVLTLNIPD